MDKFTEILEKLNVERLDARLAGYLLLIFGGIFVYVFSAINIYYVSETESFRLVSKILLGSYFVVGLILIHITHRFFNRKVWYFSLISVIATWTIVVSSLCALQVASAYPLIQMIFLGILSIQLICLVLVVMRRNAPVASLKAVFKLYVFLMLFWLALSWGPPLINGDGFWRWNSPNHVRWYEKQYGVEVADAIVGPFTVIMVLSIVFGVLIWGFVKLFTKWRFEDIYSEVSGYVLFYPSDFRYKGIKGSFAYSIKGETDFPDNIMLVDGKQGVYHFNRILFRGSEEELIFFKEEGMKEGFFLCEVVGSDKKSEKVIALYQEKKGNWRPFEIEEVIETKTRSD
ncbi:hypothetical protein NSQ26_14020 [Bacillus sp. FSL W7-1360]